MTDNHFESAYFRSIYIYTTLSCEELDVVEALLKPNLDGQNELIGNLYSIFTLFVNSPGFSH